MVNECFITPCYYEVIYINQNTNSDPFIVNNKESDHFQTSRTHSK